MVEYMLLTSRRIKCLILVLCLCVFAEALYCPAALANQSLPITGMSVSDSYVLGPYYRYLTQAMRECAGLSPAERYVKIALSQNGYLGSSDRNNLTGNGNGGIYTEYSKHTGCFGDDWCASFVSWCAEAAGIPERVIPRSNGAGKWRSTNVGTFHRIWSEDFTTYVDYKPQVGDLCLYMGYHDVSGCKKHYNTWDLTAHVVIVASVNNTRNSDGSWTFTTIERAGGNQVGSNTLTTKTSRGKSGTCQHGLNTGSTYAHVVQGFFHPDWSGASAWSGSSIDTEKPVIGSRSIHDATKDGYRITAQATDNAGVAFWKVATWNDQMGLPDDSWDSVANMAVWKVVSADSSGSLNCTVNLSDFDGVADTVYHSNLYAFDAFGNQSMGVRAGDVYIDGTKPVITGKSIQNVTRKGFDVTAAATDDHSGIDHWEMAVWNDAMGLEDTGWNTLKEKAYWLTVDVSGNTNRDLNYHINTANYGGAVNTTWHVNVYAFDGYGNQGMGHRAGDVYLEDARPRITDVRITNVTSEGYDVVATATDDYAIRKWKVATWNDTMGLADSSWDEVQAKGKWVEIPAGGGTEESLTYHVSVSDFSYARDTVYHSNAYVIDDSDTWGMGMRAGNVAVLNYSGNKILNVPSGVQRIDADAFAGISAEVIILPGSCTAVGANAFGGMAQLRYLVIPAGLNVSGAGVGANVKVISVE